jgi:DNA-binding NtrC family response regulator
VDDEPEVISMIVRALLPKHSVIGITGGSDLVAWVTHREINLVLLDVLLPDSNAFNLLSELMQACPGVFTIMSGTNPSSIADQARSAGADHFLTKPIDLGELLDVIKRFEDGTIARKARGSKSSS